MRRKKCVAESIRVGLRVTKESGSVPFRDDKFQTVILFAKLTTDGRKDDRGEETKKKKRFYCSLTDG